MKWIILFSINLLSAYIQGQNTFSRIYDLDTIAIKNISIDLEVMQGEVFVSSSQICRTDSSGGLCSAVSKFDLRGNIQKLIEFDTIFPGLSDNLEVGSNNIYFSGFEQRTPIVREKSYFVSLTSNLEVEMVNKYDDSAGRTINNHGINSIDSCIYLYNDLISLDNEPTQGQILKINGQTKELVWEKRYTIGDSKLDINSLQPTPDGNMAFILRLESSAGAGSGRDGYQIAKIDQSGELLDTFYFEDAVDQPNRLLVSDDGSYYFSSWLHPLDNWNTSVGRINKLSSDMSSVEWSLIPPNDPLEDGRFYRMYDYMEVSNGDIIVCGMVRDDTDSEIPGPDKHTTWNGFILRLTPNGEIVWLHLYRNPNDLLPQDEYGRYRPSVLKKIKELDDGRFMAVGDVWVNNAQFAAINGLETEAFHLWLLLVDENGCLEDYPCEEIIRLNNQKDGLVDIDSRWIYQTDEYFGGGNSIIDYKAIEIQDTLQNSGPTKYILGPADTLYFQNSKMYFWDKHFEEYIMYFDFDNTSQYTIKYWDQFRETEEIATVEIDSVSFTHFGNDSLKTQHVRIINSGTMIPYNVDVYEGIGASEYGLKFVLGCGLCDNNPITTKLRCFSNSKRTYNFVQYACDSTWLTTSTLEIPEKQFQLVPNPTSGLVSILGLTNEVQYQLFSPQGILLEEGTIKDQSLEIKYPGLSILRVKINDIWFTEKVILQ